MMAEPLMTKKRFTRRRRCILLNMLDTNVSSCVENMLHKSSHAKSRSWATFSTCSKHLQVFTKRQRLQKSLPKVSMVIFRDCHNSIFYGPDAHADAQSKLNHRTEGKNKKSKKLETKVKQIDQLSRRDHAMP